MFYNTLSSISSFISSGARDYSQHDTLLITDGHSNCNEDVRAASLNLQTRSNVFAMAIGVGSDMDARHEIQTIVSSQDPRHLFSLANFQDFEDMVKLINTKKTVGACQDIIVGTGK